MLVAEGAVLTQGEQESAEGTMGAESSAPTQINSSQMQEVDEQVARSIAQEENALNLDEEYAFSTFWPEDEPQPEGQTQPEITHPPISDELLARSLQQEENEVEREELGRARAALREDLRKRRRGMNDTSAGGSQERGEAEAPRDGTQHLDDPPEGVYHASVFQDLSGVRVRTEEGSLEADGRVTWEAWVSEPETNRENEEG